MRETLEPASPSEFDEQAERLMREPCDRSLKIATAESCTGGMLAALLTEIEESGFVAYTEQAKALAFRD